MNKFLQKGFSQVFVLLGMLLLALSLPLATKLVQQNQDERSKAAESNYTAQSIFKIAFKGVKPSYVDSNGKSYNCFDQLNDLSLEMVSTSKKIYQTNISISLEPISGEVNSNGDQIFKINNIPINSQFSPSEIGNYFRIKGFFYLANRMCLDNQSNKMDTLDKCNIDLANSTKTYNFSNYSLKPGDINQDGIVNSLDYVDVKNNFGSEEDVTCGQTGDLNLDGRVNSLDANLLKNSLSLEDDNLVVDQLTEVYPDSSSTDTTSSEEELDSITNEIVLEVTPDTVTTTLIPTSIPTSVPTFIPTLTPTKTQSTNPPDPTFILGPTLTSTPTLTPIPTHTSIPTKIIFIGDSHTVRLAGNGGKYKINYKKRNIAFIAKSGTTHSYWFLGKSPNINKVYSYISKISNMNCAIVIGLGTNDLRIISASSAEEGTKKIISSANNYIISVINVANRYSSKCNIYFLSVNPVETNKSILVYPHDSNASLTKAVINNNKIEIFNANIKKLILNSDVSNLKYVDTNSYFVQLKDSLKNGFTTSDGVHYNEKTTQLVYDKILELTGF